MLLNIVYILFFNPLVSHALTFSEPALDVYWDNVVQIKTEAVDTDGSEVPAYCNGTLLSSRTIVTAAHCLIHAEVLKSFAVQVEVGSYKYVTRPDGKVVRVGYVTKLKQEVPAKFFFTASVNRTILRSKLKAQPGPGDDIAIIILTENLPLPPDFPFGTVVSKIQFNGIKNNLLNYLPSVVTINFFEQMSTDTKRAALLNKVVWNSSHSFESKSQARVQAGDSGAPFFVKIGNDWKIAAVVKGLASTFFSNWDVYSTTDTNLCEISASVTQSKLLNESEAQNLLCP